MEELKEEEKLTKIDSRTPEELKKIVEDLLAQKLFTSLHLKDLNDLPRVFMPFALGAWSHFTKEAAMDIGMIYESYDQAGPRSINGLPIFTSFKLINTKDASYVFAKYKEIKKAQDDLLEKI